LRGRKPAQKSRANDFRRKLVEWKQTPESSRPSLRALARELGTSHQSLGYYLTGLEEWRWEKELKAFRAKAKAKNLTLTPADERRYLNWLRKVEERQARDAAKAARRDRRQAALLDSLKYLLRDSRRHFEP